MALVCRFGRAGLTRLASFSLRGGVLAVLACLAQLGSVFTHQRRLELLLVSAVLLGIFCWLNRRRAGLPVATLGVTLNLLVMGANGGTMPIGPATFARMSNVQARPGTAIPFSKDRLLEDHQARLAWLDDRLLLPGPLGRLAVWSVGDVLILAGIGRLLWQTMKGSDDDERAFRPRAALPRARATDLRRGQQSAICAAAGGGAGAGAPALRAWTAAFAGGMGARHVH